MTQPDLFSEPETRASQNAQVLAHLQSGRSITPLESLELYGCFRLGARIFQLKKQGHNITSTMIKTPQGKHVAQYRLVQ